jgi:hypothetical protein
MEEFNTYIVIFGSLLLSSKYWKTLNRDTLSVGSTVC